MLEQEEALPKATLFQNIEGVVAFLVLLPLGIPKGWLWPYFAHRQ